MPVLTAEQRQAATSPYDCVYVVAAPGCGKTTVAAERFGFLRYGPNSSAKGIRALSFTRSATRELRLRIRSRWGSSATAWPNQVSTLDNLYCDIVGHLLRTEALTWFGGRTEIEVVDTWSGQRNARLIPANRYKRIIALNGTTVSTRSVQMKGPSVGMGTKAALENHLTAGLCTHEDIRVLTRLIFRSDALRPLVASYLGATMSALIVDELFDANPLDLDLVRLCIAEGVPVSLVGDPWQALYEFRDATPELVPDLLEEHGFSYHIVQESFRFQTAEMTGLSSSLRERLAVIVPAAPDNPDVVLAGKWATLWAQDDHVLPLSFGTIGNLTDAILSVVLDYFIGTRLADRATFATDARAILELEPERAPVEQELLVAALQHIAAHGTDAPADSLTMLRHLAVAIGGRKPTALGATKEQGCLRRVERLAGRINFPGPSVPAMTVHQAKGREWNRVAVTLTPTERDRLGVGLDPEVEDDRQIYVALTRARIATGLVSI